MGRAFPETAVLSLVILALAGCASSGHDPAFSGAPREAIDAGRVPLNAVQPGYPRQAAMARVQGCATVSFDIMPDGQTDNFRVLDSRPQGVFVKTTLLALRDWRYPQRDEPLRVQQTIKYNLEGVPGEGASACEQDPELPETYWVR